MNSCAVWLADSAVLSCLDAAYEVADEQFKRIEDLLPEVGGRECLGKNHWKLVNVIFWILRSGAPWQDLPERYGNWKTVYDRFCRWAEDGTLEQIRRHVLDELDAEGRRLEQVQCRYHDCASEPCRLRRSHRR